MAMTDPHELVVKVFLVRRMNRTATRRSAHNSEESVENRYTLDDQRNENRREEEKRLTRELLGGSAAHRHG